MEHIDFEYLCRVIGNLAGIPVRIYKDKEQTFFYSVVDFPADPIEPYLENVFAITEQNPDCTRKPARADHDRSWAFCEKDQSQLFVDLFVRCRNS